MIITDERILHQVSVGTENADYVASAIKREMGKDALGLAAIQIGIPSRIIGVRLRRPGYRKSHITIMLNPEITVFGPETEKKVESCLSCARDVIVERYVEITVKYDDLQGFSHSLTFRGIQARIIQHEIDHLNGVLITDQR